MTFKDTYQVVCLESVETALDVLESNPDNVAAIVTDQQMPNGKGMDLIRAVKLRHPQITRMLTTAYADLDIAIESVNKGEVFRYILKPWNVEELQQYLNEALQAYIERQEEKHLLAEKRQSIFKVASNIAHELRTPLAGIYATVNGIQDDFPALLEGYESAAAHQPELKRLSSDRLKTIHSAFRNIERQVQHSQAMISMLLENIRDDVGRNVTIIRSMKQCLAEALDTYPFFKQQREKVILESTGDFAFHGNMNAMINVFHNLVKNSLYAIQASADPQATIRITLKGGERENQLIFRDEGVGITPDVLPFIFDDFYSSKGAGGDNPAKGNGIGLAFCKRALNSWSADIECHSVPGSYTEFILKFPNPENFI